MSDLFTNLNPNLKLVVLSDKTAEGLRAQILAVRTQMKILNIYADNGTHYAWVFGQIKKKG